MTSPATQQAEGLTFAAYPGDGAVLLAFDVDQGLSLDVFAYDFDEPDIIRQLGQLGPRLRLYLDNSASHIGDTAREPKAHDWLTAQGAQIKVGHFQRFSHDKVLIQKRGDTGLKVLSGSANFSVRGLYVQSKRVMQNSP